MRTFSLTRILMICACLGLLTGCRAKKPILIGFAGELTGKRSELGVEARDGAQLAIEEINANGGIHDRHITLLVRDDQGDPEYARQIDAELVKEGVVAIIGHITSTQTAAVFDQMNAAKVILFSPASSSAQFSGQADYFFRSVQDTELLGAALATYVVTNRKGQDILCVYDERNQVFAKSFLKAFEIQVNTLGGEVTAALPFSSGATDLAGFMADVTTRNPKNVLIIASPVDTALLIQYGRQQGLNAAFYSSSWTQTRELLEKGGRAIDGLALVASHHPHNPYPAFQPFIDQFEARYHRHPEFLAFSAYEAVVILAHALEQTRGEMHGLTEALAKIHNFEGVRGSISLDRFGDVQRDVYIAVVKNGQFEIIETITPK